MPKLKTKIEIKMNLDLTKPVRLKYPLNENEKDMTFNVKNYNEITKRCYIELICDWTIKPQELVDVGELINI